jgi:hypothetical protein
MRLLTLALLALSTSPAAAEALPVRLADGATWTVTIEHVRERERPGAAAQTTRLSTISEARWTRAADGGRLTLTPKDVKLDGSNTEPPDLQSLQSRPAVFGVDEALAPVRLENWDELRGAIAAELEKTSVDPEARAQVVGVLDGLSDEQAAKVMGRSWSMASLAQGSDLSLGEDNVYDDLLPNPLGGPPIKSVGRFKLQSVDKAAGRAVVVWTQSLDPASTAESIRQALQAMVERMAPEQAEAARKAFSSAKITREDACRHEIDIPTGLALKAVCTSTSEVTVEGKTGTSRDRWTIAQTQPQTPAKTN